MNFTDYYDIFNEKNYPIFRKKRFANKEVYIPLDNKPCICLSGKKYKNCCKEPIEEAFKNRNEKTEKELEEIYYRKTKKTLSYNIVDKSIRKKNLSYCSANGVFNDCDTINNNVHAHTLSEKNILKNLTEDFKDRLITFNDHKMIDVYEIINNISDYYTNNIKTKNASVIVGFCKKHDKELFIDIETDGKKAYKKTDIQNLEYALKAVSFDVYKKVMIIRYMSELISKNKNVVYYSDRTHSNYFNDYYYTQKTLFDLYNLMKKIILEIKNLKEKKIKPKLKNVCFELSGKKINFSCSEIIYKWNTYCFVNVINSKKPYIIISYYEDGECSEIKELDKIKNKFESLKFNKYSQIEYLWGFIITLLSNAQNIFFIKTAFEKLSDKEKSYLYIIHRFGNIGLNKIYFCFGITIEEQIEINKKLKKILFEI